MPNISKCGDCGMPYGSRHDMFCTKETCPYCFGQLASCGCIKSVLGLNEHDQKVVDEYKDDFSQPLSGIVKRWSEVLDEKGRLPVGFDISRPR